MRSPYSDREAAGTYRLVTGPAQFAPPAADLVAMLAPRAGMAMLDVGTGTGIVAGRIRDAVGPQALLVGVDAAYTMLEEGRRALRYPVAVACVPGLPFADRAFDLVAAAFVITHVPDYAAALRDVVRVCRRGARVGVSVWGALPNPAAQLWSDIASRFVPRAELDEAFRRHLPWDGWFSDPERLRDALHAAGLRGVVETRSYTVRMSTVDFLTSRAVSVQGVVFRERLAEPRWPAFTEQLRAAFETRFGNEVVYERDVHFGVAERPN